MQECKEWLKIGSKSALQVEDTCLAKHFLTHIAKLSGSHQTWNLGAFHSLLNNFAPKMYAFSPIEMEYGVKLAALHYNENAGLQQYTTSDGKLAYQIKYPKYKKGGYIVQKILQDKTYDYVMALWDQVWKECQQTCHDRRSAATAVELPPTLCEDLVHPQKEDAIREHQTRYHCKQ